MTTETSDWEFFRIQAKVSPSGRKKFSEFKEKCRRITVDNVQHAAKLSLFWPLDLSISLPNVSILIYDIYKTSDKSVFHWLANNFAKNLSQKVIFM